MDTHEYLRKNPMYAHRAAAFFTTNMQERNVQGSIDHIANELAPPGSLFDLLDALYADEKIPLAVWFNYTVALKQRETSQADALAYAHEKRKEFPELSDDEWREQVFKPVDKCANPPRKQARISYLRFY